MASFSLKKELSNRLLVDMIGSVKKKINAGDFMCLVVDRRTSKILSSSARMFDVMQTDVMIIENLTVPREKLDFHAIYFIENSDNSIKFLLDDFRPNQKKPQYRIVHLFFTGRVSTAQMQLIQSRKELVQRIKTFQELNVDFLSFESRVFSFGSTCKTIANLYLNDGDNQDEKDTDLLAKELEKISQQLVSLCLTLKEDPYIRYWTGGKGNAGPLSKALATYVEMDLKKKKGELKDWAPNENRSKGTLLIVDRSIDPAAALMHEYTYQAMVNDLLPVNGEILTLPGKGKKKQKTATTETTETTAETTPAEGKQENKKDEDSNIIVLSEADDLWNKLRHLHISQAMDQVAKDFNSFKETNKMAQFQAGKKEGKDKDLKGMVAAAKNLAQYKEMVAKFSKHQDLLKLIMKIFRERSLKDLGDLEQNMATGLTEEGADVIVKKVKQELVGKCQSEEIEVIDKMRLLMVYMVSQGGIQKGTLQELMKTIDNSLKDALYNLPKIGVDIDVAKDKKNKPTISAKRKAEFVKQSKQVEIILMRYAPFLQSVMVELIHWDLKPDLFPYTTPPPEGTKKPKATKAPTRWRRNRTEEKEDDRPLYIVFILGGVTYSEMRLIYTAPELQKAKIIIGGTDVLTPGRFIRGLANLSRQEYVQSINRSEGNGKTDPNYLVDGEDSDIEFEPVERKEKPAPAKPQIEEPPEDWFSSIDRCLDKCCPCLDKYLLV